MRLRVGLLLCLFTVIAIVGCRKPLTPNVDRNKAPETWITAAPFDTITLVKGVPPLPSTIPIRFHVYWAGSDQDGAVVGYYIAVVETVIVSPEGGGTPPLPGPHPVDYHYTTRSDSFFVFNVTEEFPDRRHAFYIYAVDDKGKPDPTPARFIFNSLDRFPPVPIFDEAVGIGSVYFFDDAGVLQRDVRTFAITDSSAQGTPKDTVPSGSLLRFRFHGQIQGAGSVVKGFRYKLDEPQYQPVDPESLFHGNLIQYNVPPEQADPARGGLDVLPVAVGEKQFLVRAVDDAGGSSSGVGKDGRRHFIVNFTPDTWFSGPDPDVPTGGTWQELPTGEKYALLVSGHLPPQGLPGSLMGPDSVQIMPVNRPHHRTFLEVYKDSVFLRKEFDTVHLGCYVIMHNGGFDTDSPYLVHVAEGIGAIDPNFPGGPVLTPSPDRNGSPIGFRSLITNYLTPNGPLSVTAQSRLYPFWDPNDVLNFQRIAAYHPMSQAGKAYSLQRAEDGDGSRDNRVDDARRVVELPIPSQRPLVLVFYVDYPPILNSTDPEFFPRSDSLCTITGRNWGLHILASDRDPFAPGSNVGGPSDASTFRVRFTVSGKDADGNPIVFYDPPKDGLQQTYVWNGGPLDLIMRPVPAELASGLVTLTVELCDCSFCELNPGEGRCISQTIQVNYVSATPSRPGLD